LRGAVILATEVFLHCFFDLPGQDTLHGVVYKVGWLPEVGNWGEWAPGAARFRRRPAAARKRLRRGFFGTAEAMP
jgi:hypothetical protein